jgi:hypothetical protein
MREALLLAIYLGHVQIAEACLRHPKFKVLNEKFTGNDDSFWQTPSSDDAQFAPDITPLILASQYNRTEIGNLQGFFLCVCDKKLMFDFSSITSTWWRSDN